jgi:hypothetical protein
MENLNQKRQQLEQALIEKAMNDGAFRKELIANPKEIIEKETGMKLPEAFNVKVLEENPQSFYLVLPAKVQPGSEDELSEAELEMVSGGYDPPENNEPDAIVLTINTFLTKK